MTGNKISWGYYYITIFPNYEILLRNMLFTTLI